MTTSPRPAQPTGSADRLRSSGPEPFEACPDGGRCWHGCPLLPASEKHPEGEGLPCWRVANASPLSAHGERWTPAERARHLTPAQGRFAAVRDEAAVLTAEDIEVLEALGTSAEETP